MSDATPSEGWKYLINAPKWHYFRGGRSLCGKWMCLGKSFEQGNDDSPDNCSACRKKLASEKSRAALALATSGETRGIELDNAGLVSP